MIVCDEENRSLGEQQRTVLHDTPVTDVFGVTGALHTAPSVTRSSIHLRELEVQSEPWLYYRPLSRTSGVVFG